jgi:lipid-A-disaccharide synthase
VDYPGFNLRLAKEIKKRNIPLIYFISPQVWAWGEKRIHLIKEVVNKMIVLFKFEEDLYQKYGIEAEFVGHPLLDMVKPTLSEREFKNLLRISEKDKVITLLPGSRISEVNRHLPIMLKAAKIIFEKSRDKKIQFLIAQTPTLKNELFQAVKNEVSIPITVIKDKTYDCLNISDLVLVCSGTATLETAIMEKPMVVIYKVSFLTALLLKPMLKISDIGLVNVAAGKRIVSECVQNKAKPRLIAQEALSILTSPQKITEIKQNLISVKQKLGSPGVTKRAAQIIFNFLQ